MMFKWLPDTYVAWRDVWLGAAVTAAASAGAVPIPFADAVILVPIQLGMMAAIAQTYGVRMDRATLAGIAATAGATSAGRSLVGGKLKLIPGHCDPTINLYDWYVCVRDGIVEDLWSITARGAVT